VSAADFSEQAGDNLRAFQERSLSDVALGGMDVQSLVAGAKTAHQRGVRRTRAAWSAGALMAAGALFAFTRSGSFGETASQDVPSYAVNEAAERSDLGTPIVAEERVKTISFDGAEFVLASGGRVNVEGLYESGADLRLVDGSVRGAVSPDAKSRWSVRAGKYVVRVVGTLFDVSLDAKTGRFEVAVEKGMVEVSGPPIEGARRLGPGERLVFEESAAESQNIPDADAGERGDKSEIAVEGEVGADVPSRSAKKAPKPSESWKSLAKDGKYKDSIAAVEAQNFDRVVSSMGVSELVQLADVARMAGNSTRAAALLHRIRSKAPGSGHAAMAAYSLGTTAFDQRGDFGTAARWFQAYLSEQPGGPLAREALGRAMEAQHRAGARSSARKSAARYLKRYPKGPHSSLAQSLAKLN